MSAPRDVRGVVAITGGGGGMGRACARLMGGGRRVVLGDALPQGLEAALQELREAGIEAHGRECDVTDPESVAEFAQLASRAGPLDALVHTAGLSSSMGSAQRILEVDLVGTAIVLDAFLPLARPGAAAVCIASMAAHRNGPQAHDELLLEPRRADFLERVEAAVPLDSGKAYDLAKRGVIVQCERRAQAWAQRGARIVSLSPGLIETPMGERAKSGRGREIVAIAPLQRTGTAEEIAEVVAFLCSERARYITGCDVRVDGGTIAAMRHSVSDQVASAWNGWGLRT